MRGRDGDGVVLPAGREPPRGRHPAAVARAGAGLLPARSGAAEATALARRLLDHLGYVGVLALELFEVERRLLANEMAPRVHNSGHWTIEGAETSQFENHVRAIPGLAARLDRRDRARPAWST